MACRGHMTRKRHCRKTHSPGCAKFPLFKVRVQTSMSILHTCKLLHFTEFSHREPIGGAGLFSPDTYILTDEFIRMP